MKNIHGVIVSRKVIGSTIESVSIIPMSLEDANKVTTKLEMKPFELIGEVRKKIIKDVFGEDVEVIIEYASFPGHPGVLLWWEADGDVILASDASRIDGHPNWWYANDSFWEWD